MKFKFDGEGHVVWTPKELYQMVLDNPRRLVDDYLMGTSTPSAFDEYTRYRDFIHAVAERTGIHPKNFYLRGSCQIGFSIAPRDKVWTAMSDASDLDLVIVDRIYFARFDEEVRCWESRNPAQFLQGKASEAYVNRQRDRQFNCCRDEGVPSVVCVHHRDTMLAVAEMQHCGLKRRLSAFIYPDWHSARQRYEYDLRLLKDGISGGKLTPPEDTPFPVAAKQSCPALAAEARQSADEPSAAKSTTASTDRSGK